MSLEARADNMLLRFELTETRDGEPLQEVKGLGRDEEQYGGRTKGILHLQGYGFSVHAPKGSKGLLAVIDGNNDKAVAFTPEHEDYRPKNLAEGQVKSYDMWGGYIHGKQDEWEHKVGDAIIRVKRNGEIHINPSS